MECTLASWLTHQYEPYKIPYIKAAPMLVNAPPTAATAPPPPNPVPLEYPVNNSHIKPQIT